MPMTRPEKKFLKQHGVNDCRHVDVKQGWEIGCVVTPDTDYYFKTISNKSLGQIGPGGLDPSKRDEANFTTRADGSYEAIVFPMMGKVFKFIFAFPSVTDDGTWSRALQNLGWLPRRGESSYMHVFKVPGLSPYASHRATINPSTEIAFPMTIETAWITKSYELKNTTGRCVAIQV